MTTHLGTNSVVLMRVHPEWTLSPRTYERISEQTPQNAYIVLWWTRFTHFSSSIKTIYNRLSLSRSPVDSAMLRDIRTSTYQIYRYKEKTNWTTTFHKWKCNLTPDVRDILKILWKRGENFYFFLQYFGTCCSIYIFKQGPDFHFEINGYSR